MSTPSFFYLRLDDNNDPVLTPQSQLSGSLAVQQAVLTRLRLFMGEWWEDTSLGLPVFQTILGQLGSARGQAVMTEAIREQIEGVPYVTSVDDIQAEFTGGKFSFTATITTAFGVTVVTNKPGSNAAVQ